MTREEVAIWLLHFGWNWVDSRRDVFMLFPNWKMSTLINNCECGLVQLRNPANNKAGVCDVQYRLTKKVLELLK